MPRGVVLDAFAKQAEWCTLLGSPFMAALCRALPLALDMETLTGRRVLGWTGELFSDALPLRLAGGLHAEVRAGRLGQLAPLYPPAPAPSCSQLSDALRAAIREADRRLQPWLDSAPQTNEVGRSAVLMAGMLEIAAATQLPLRLFELGSSAGLNLRLDHYAYRLGGLHVEREGAPIRLSPDWHGPPPANADVCIIARRGVDISPIDATDGCARERLLAYVWPDQTERLQRLSAALDAAAADPPVIDRADAADWTETHVTPAEGAVTVVFHSIAFQYFPAPARQRIAAHMERMGGSSTCTSPLAWLRYESETPSAGVPPTLRLKLWPDGEDRLLAHAHPHGASLRWVAATA